MNSGVSEKILDLASELIAERGVWGMSFGDIAKGVGISKGTLSYYYPNKQALVDAAASRAAKNISDSILAWVDSVRADEEPEAPIGRLCAAMFGTSFRVFIEANQAVVPGTKLEEILDSAMSEWNVMIDVGAMRMKPNAAMRMKRMSAAILPFLAGLSALNADADYAKEAFVALILG